MTALNYTAGTVSLTNGSAVVTGVGTAWQIALIVGGTIYVEAAGNPLPIDSVDSDTQITAAIAWAGATGAYNYVLRRSTTYDEQVAKNAEIFARLVAELEAGTIWKYDASGDTAGKAFYDTRPKGFSYLDTSGAQPALWVKASNDEGDWAGPFAYGVGPQGPAPNLTFSPVVTGAPGTPASLEVTGAGPYDLAFTVPAGIQGFKGWTIETEIVADGLRSVMRVADFIGGEGAKPSGIGHYVGHGGLVANIADAVNIRGMQGPLGPRGVRFRGNWSSSENYILGDLVVDEDTEGAPASYISNTTNTNSKPRDNPSDWAFFPGSIPATINDGVWGETISETANDGVWGA